MSSNVEWIVTARRTGRKAHEAGVFAHVQISLVVDGTPYVDLRDAALRVSTDGQSYWLSPPSRPYEANGQKKYSAGWYLFPKSERDVQNQWGNFLVGKVLEVLPNPEVPAEDAGAYSNQAPPTQQLPPAPPAQRNAAPAPQQSYAAPSGPPMPSMPQAAPVGQPPQVGRPVQARPATQQPFRPPAVPSRQAAPAPVGPPPMLGGDDGFPA